MSLPKSIPMREVNGFSFLGEVDFFKYKERLPHFVGEAGYEKPTDENTAVRIPRVVGFLDEAARAQVILTSSLTNSVHITGHEGVGKSALLLFLLNKVAVGDVAPTLLSKHYFVFNMHEFFKLSPQDQVKQFDAAMDYMSKQNSLIIIDRIDDFVANCGPDRARRLMGSLINALENQRVNAVITSQTQNHQQVDQTSTLFSRVFQELPVGERSAIETLNILRQMVPRFERTHKVIIGDDALCELVRLDQRYEGRLKGQSPNRLIEFLDQLAASVNIAKYGKPVELLQQELQLVELLAEEETLKMSVRPSAKKLADVQERIQELKTGMQPLLDAWTKKFGTIRKTREDLVEAVNILAPLQAKYERYQAQKEKDSERRQIQTAAKERGEDLPPIAAEDVIEPLTQKEMDDRDRYIRVERVLRERLSTLEKDLYVEAPHVTVADVQARFSKVVGVSAQAVSTNDADRLLKVEEGLSRNVFGQDRPKAALANIYRTREAGTSDPTRPAGVILFIGGPGCGKTELVETMGAYDGGAIISYNMNIYTDSSSVSRLIGASPGLVGFGQTVTLPDAVKAKPKCFLFFDEIEKAHPDLQRTIMQVMDKGVMPDSMNLPVYFKDTIIILASNVLRESDFTSGEKLDDVIIRKKLTEAVNQKTGLPYFLPEFIGRIDSVQLFDDVTPEIANKILHKQITNINGGIAARGYTVDMDEKEAEKIVGVYFDPTQGGRSIRQLDKNILRPLITQRLLTRQATETSDDEDELKPMVLKIDDRTISVDGHTLDSAAHTIPTPAVLEPPVPKPRTPFQSAATATLGGGASG